MTARAGGCSRFIRFGSGFAGLLLLLGMMPAYGLGLGGMRVQSGLGEPFSAEIDLTSATAAELSTLEVTLGTDDVFDNAGITRYQFLTLLEFEIVDSTPAVIRVTTALPIIEPFLHFVIRARWDLGMLLSEYTALLDPPLYGGQQSGSVSAPVVFEESDQPVVTSIPEASVSSQPIEPISAPQPQTAGASAGGFQYGPVAPGDNLWNIASQVDTAGLDANIFQVMIAILRENPGAFVDNNINRLKSGETLSLGDRNTILLVSKSDASQTYKTQMEQWEAGQSKTMLATQSEQTPPQPEQIQEQPESGAEAPVEPAMTDVVQVEPSQDEIAEEGAGEPPAGNMDEEAPTVSEGQQTDAQQTASDKYVFKITPPELESGSGAPGAVPDVEVEVEAMRAAIDREIIALREQVARLELQQLQFESSSETQSEIESVKAEAEKEIEGLREQIAFLKQAAADQEILALRGQLAAMKQQDAMPVDPAGTSAALAEAQQEIQDLRAQVAALSKEPKEQTTSGQQDFSDLSNQVQMPEQGASATDANVEIDAIRAAANEQINVMREQMEAMRAEMGKLLEAQNMREKENTDLEQRVSELVGLLEGKVESTTLATLTTPAGTEQPSTDSGDTAAEPTKARVVAVGEGEAGPVWEKWLDELPEDDESRIAIGAGILLILFVLWLMIRRRRSLMRMQESILMTGATLDGQTSQLSEIRSKKRRYLSDLSMAGMGRMEAAEVDPLAEAEVYLAYGRAGQAVQVLKEAAGRNPNRQELKLKLLEIYQQQEDVKSFDDLVSDMNLSEGSGDQEAWNKVVELKLRMHEDGPLESLEMATDDGANGGDVSGGGVSGGAGDDAAEWELTLDDSDQPQTPAKGESDAELAQDLLEISTGPVDPALRPFPEPDDNARVGEDVLGSLGRPDQLAVSADDDKTRKEQRPEDTEMMNFATSNHSELNFDLDTTSADRVPDAGSSQSDGRDPAASTGSGESSGEISIKAELAEAYLNMGDKEEALRILKEILVNAGPDQKQRITDLVRRASQ